MALWKGGIKRFSWSHSVGLRAYNEPNVAVKRGGGVRWCVAMSRLSIWRLKSPLSVLRESEWYRYLGHDDKAALVQSEFCAKDECYFIPRAPARSAGLKYFIRPPRSRCLERSGMILQYYGTAAAVVT